MILFDVSDLSRHLLAASGSGYLYRRLRAARSVQFLSYSRKAQELFDALIEILLIPTPTREEVVRGYAFLTALLMKPEALSFPLDTLPVSAHLGWTTEIVEKHRARAAAVRNPDANVVQQGTAQKLLLTPVLHVNEAANSQGPEVPLVIRPTAVKSTR
jgi:hypothetical protein